MQQLSDEVVAMAQVAGKEAQHLIAEQQVKQLNGEEAMMDPAVDLQCIRMDGT